MFRINSLLNQLMGVPEDTTDDEGRPSIPAGAAVFEDLAVSSPVAAAPPAEAQALAQEPAEAYYQRLFGEYINAKRQAGDPVDHITESAFVAHIRQNEQQALQRTGTAVRYKVELQNGAITLVAVQLP